MDFLDETKLVLFIGFVVPGFIAMKAHELLIPGKRADSSKQIVDAIAYSCLNYALLLWPIFQVESISLKQTHPNLYVLFYVLVLFVAPVLWVVLWKMFRELEIIQGFIPHPTQKPWDYVFGKRRQYWLVVTLKSGNKVAGMYGPDSFASSAPSNEELYHEEEWILNDTGAFDRPVKQTSGIIVLASEIETVELYNSGDDGDE